MTPSASSESGPLLEPVTVLLNDRVADGVGLLRLHAPRIASSVEPGQFVHVRITEGADFILRRPFSVYRAAGEAIDLLYQVVGRGTLELAEKRAGDVMDAIGPLGTGWDLGDGVGHALLVAGGLGAAPLVMLAERLAARGTAVTVALGAPTCGAPRRARGVRERRAARRDRDGRRQRRRAVPRHRAEREAAAGRTARRRVRVRSRGDVPGCGAAGRRGGRALPGVARAPHGVRRGCVPVVRRLDRARREARVQRRSRLRRRGGVLG